MTNTRRKRSSTRRRRRQIQLIKRILFSIFIIVAAVSAVFVAKRFIDRRMVAAIDQMSTEDPGRPELDVQLLTVNEYSRPGIPLNKINSIVIHYTANPGSSAKANRDYFENLKDTHTTKASSHFIVGLEGEIVQCIPTAEISYASNNRNNDTISIEVCHEDESGVFSEATYQSVVHLTAWLCNRSGLSPEEVIRHYDITGKMCPKYYVEHEDAWVQFKADVAEMMEYLSGL